MAKLKRKAGFAAARKRLAAVAFIKSKTGQEAGGIGQSKSKVSTKALVRGAKKARDAAKRRGESGTMAGFSIKQMKR